MTQGRTVHIPPVGVTAAILLYATTMAYLEAAVVVYLRAAIGVPTARIFPIDLSPAAMPYGWIEVGREAATLAMIGAVAWIAGRRAPHTPRGRGQDTLGSDRRIQRCPWCGKDGEDAVAGLLDDGAAVGRDRLLEEAEVLRESRSHRPGMRLPRAGASLDIGEEEGERASCGGGRHQPQQDNPARKPG